MRKFLQLLSLVAGLLVLPVSHAVESQVTRDPYKYFFNETWNDFSEELQNARQSGKQAVLLFFEMDDCPFCYYMKTNVLNQPQVQEYYRQHFLSFPVDIEGDIEMVNFKGTKMKQKDFAFKEYRVRATPVIAFFDLDGKLIHRHTGKTSGVEEFLWMGEYVAKGIYKQMPFVKYKRQKRGEK